MRMLTTQEASKLYGLPAETFAQLARDGRLVGARQVSEHGPWEIPDASIEDYLDQHPRLRPREGRWWARFNESKGWVLFAILTTVLGFAVDVPSLWDKLLSGGLVSLWVAVVVVSGGLWVVSLYVMWGRVQVQNRWMRRVVDVTVWAMPALLVLGIVGYLTWWIVPAQQTVVLVTDFVDPTGMDSARVTQTLVDDMRTHLADYQEEISVVRLNEVIPAEGAIERAIAVGQQPRYKAAYVIWGDYKLTPEPALYLRFLVTENQNPLQGFGRYETYPPNEIQQLTMFGFNTELSKHLSQFVVFLSGLALFQAEKFEASLPFFETVAASPDLPLMTDSEAKPHYWYYKGTTELILEKPEVAEKSFDEAIRLNPEYADAYTNRGVARYMQEDLVGAVADYDEAIRLDPEGADAYNNRGGARYKQEDLVGAMADYDEAIRLNPEHAGAYNNRGKARSDQGDLAGAVADYDEAIRLDPEFAMAYITRGDARYDLGDRSGAIADYGEAIRLNPEDTEAYIKRGNARYFQKDLAGAVADYDEAIRLNPEYATAFHNRGNARKDQGELAGAVADYDEAIRLNPEYATAFHNRGNARKDQGELAGAVADYDEAIRLNPEYADAYTNRGVARYVQGDLAGAVADYDEAIRLNPADATAYNNWGVVRYVQGDLVGAVADYDEAIRLNPEYATAYTNRGLARYDQGDLVGAMADYLSGIFFTVLSRF